MNERKTIRIGLAFADWRTPPHIKQMDREFHARMQDVQRRYRRNDIIFYTLIAAGWFAAWALMTGVRS